MTYSQRHLLAIEGLHPPEIAHLLDLAESYVLLNRSGKTQRDLLRGRTLINLFFEDSTRTRTSFELAGKRLGADVINMSVSTSSVSKGDVTALKSNLAQVHTDLTSLITHAKGEWQTQTSALQSALTKLQTAISDLSSSPGASTGPSRLMLAAATTAAANPPTAPSQVFFGLRTGAIRCRPRNRPVK